MSSSLQPPRIGDAERDEAVTLLQEHTAVGRLDSDEFNDRMSRALSARTQGDLDPLFSDLPDPRPGQVSTAAPAGSVARALPQTTRAATPAHRRAGMMMIGVAVAIAVILGASAFGFQHWWFLIMIPVFITVCTGRGGACGRRRT